MIDTGISIAFEVSGPSALFTDPIMKISGEKMSYLIPTYGALQGMAKNIYFKPTFDWVIEKVRVMNRIRTQSRGAKLMKYKGGPPDLANYLYLVEVRYQVLGHLVWNDNLPEYAGDRIVEKHKAILERTLENIGSRRPSRKGVS